MKTLNGAAALRAAQEKVGRRSNGSAELYERSRRLMPGGVTSNIRYADPHPLYVRDARGARIWDVDGQEYVDCRLGFGPVILGHSPEVITASVMRALMNGTVYALPHAGETELAEKVIDAVPGAEMTTFCSSGSEATLHALRLARAYTGRKKIAKFEGGYHGIHDTVMMPGSLLGAQCEGRPHSPRRAGPGGQARDPTPGVRARLAVRISVCGWTGAEHP
jgi:glutamate-1-semialdehyde 2,1-aminomutase